MSAEMIARIIQVIIAPVVMITSCSVMLNGLLGHYAAINVGIRAMVRERLDLLRAKMDDSIRSERLQEIDTEMPQLLRRHRLVRNATLAIYSAILIFVVDMFSIAMSAVTDLAWITGAVLILFLGGTAAMLLGTALIAMEIRSSHQAVEFEVQRVLSLDRTLTPD